MNKKDNLGDYALWFYRNPEGIGYWQFLNEYLTGLVFDAEPRSPPVLWGITDKGNLFTNYQYKGASWEHYFSPLTFTSLAAQNPAIANPNGFLFATSKTKTYQGSGPTGSLIMLFEPTYPSQFPKGKWKNEPFGAYQLSADPKTTTIADLDSNGNVWEIVPTKNKQGKFIGWVVYPLGHVQCADSRAIDFLQVAVNNETFLGLDDAGSVWYYSLKNKCWSEVGTKQIFVSIAADDGTEASTLVWATDNSGNIWFAH